MSFNRDNLRKGSKAIEEALASRGSGGDGDFRPFLSNLYWKNDKDHRYLLFLNPLEEIPEVDFHPYVDCGDSIPHMCFARTDRSIGDSSDPLQETWGYKPRLTGLAIAVELEPVEEIVGGRPKPVGFEVKTVTFERRIRDDDGELTEEREEVTAPVVGLVAQSPYNFFNQLKQIDAEDGAIHTTPLKITRLGQKENVTYSIKAYDTIEPDLSNLFGNVQNLSYVLNDDRDELLTNIDEAESNEEKIIIVGDYLLYRRLEELADDQEYEDIFSKVTKPAKFQDKPKEEKAERQARPSQRRTREAEPTEETAKEKVTKESPATARLEQLRARGSGKRNK